MMLLFLSLGVSLLLTLLFELGFALLWSIRTPALRRGRELTIVALVNILTNPAVVLLANYAQARHPGYPLGFVLLLEIGAVLVEWFCYRACSEALRHPFLFSLCANLFSVLAGFALAALL